MNETNKIKNKGMKSKIQNLLKRHFYLKIKCINKINKEKNE